ncbi:adhesion G protein-coupled receptor F5-like isoform X10 [Anguilla anguilla]|uniref:adhesion G protein-coupled receptor F5-like isoform X10 n=1 Tax=Anguilla anguilla TaxID=7936 RepID=UPI0015AC8AB2|nr:adhesion G protein-coupled receptor F5-like isoform X10 [Anguilla anguilla]
MAILKTVFSLTLLLVIGNIFGTEGLDSHDNLSQVTHTDVYVPLDHLRLKRETLRGFEDYIIEIELSVSSISVVEELKTVLNSVGFPLRIEGAVNITDVNISTVCSPVDSGFQCKCEEEFSWSLESCRKYSNCSAITANTCGCINAIPPNGPFCELNPAPQLTPVEYIIEIEVNVSDIAVVNQLKSLLDSINFPFQLDHMIEITAVNLTTVCSKCGCVNAITPDGTFCPPVTTPSPTLPTNTTPSLNVSTTQEPNTTASFNESTTQESNTTSSFNESTTQEPNTTSSSNVSTTQQPNTTTSSNVSTTREPKKPEPNTPSATLAVTSGMLTTATAKTAKFGLQMSFRIVDRTFDDSLSDTSSQEYMKLEIIVRNAIDKNYMKTVEEYIGVSDIRFSNGSVITKYTVRTNKVSSSDIEKANQAIVETLQHQSYNVDPKSFTAALIEDTFAGLPPVFAGDDMSLRCDPQVDTLGNPVTWRVKGQNVTNNSKYIINKEQSSLTVKNLVRSESGIYKCSVNTGVVEFIRSQDITVLPAPTVFVEKQVINSHCNTAVKLTCCGQARNFLLEWIDKQSGKTLSSQGFSEDNCTTMDRRCQNVETRVFICKMTFRSKAFTQEATLRFFEDGVIFSCDDGVYGLGRENDIAVVGCSRGAEGSRAARCERGKWTFVNNTCLLPEIKELQFKSLVLDQEGVDAFVQELRNITSLSKDEVAISTANILTVVNILNNVINVINGNDVSSTVVENFLQTVDILVSTETEGTWGLLNEGNSTNRTGSDLLNSVEEIAKVIRNTSVSITTSTMQLNKTIFFDEFNISFLNSTDEIIVFGSMPSFQTEITTVHFRTLDIVLPPRNLTSSNNTINSAVLLAYTNSTITNITLTFQIRNTTLGNPQCVFWNFTETAWDSSGCEVKNVGNENITCVCNHLTSFSILMSPFIPEAIRLLLDFITYIGVGISMGSLVLCLIIEAIVWTAVTRNNISYMRHVTIVNIAVSLLIANIWFIIGAAISDIDEKTPVGPCSAATFFIHFFYLALFFWMLISGVLLFYHMVMVFSHMSKRVMMAISFTVGYGAPLIIAVVTVAVTAPQNGYFRQDDACWLNWFQTKALLAFVIPALAIVAINFIILIVVLYKLIRRGVGENQTDERNALVVIARCVAVLTPFFGLTWGFGIGVMVAPESVGLHIVFAVLNSLQGFFVLVFGTLLDSRIRAALAGRFSFIHTSSNRTRSTSGGPSSSSGLGLFRRRRRRDTYHVSEVASSSQSTAASESFLNT